MGTKKRVFLFSLVLIATVDAYILLIARDLRSLDARLYYSIGDIFDLFRGLGESGRLRYFREEIFDLTFLTAYTILIFNAASWLCKKRNTKFTRGIQILCILPGFFDLIETGGILILLKCWPDLGQVLPAIVATATPLKWGSGLVLTAWALIRLLTKSSTYKI